MSTGEQHERAEAEFTIEPFVEGAPGPHVTQAIDAVRATGIDVEVGPFGTAVEGDLDAVLAALGAAVRAAAAAGAERVSVQVTFRASPAEG